MKKQKGEWHNSNNRWHRYYGPAVIMYENATTFHIVGKWFLNGQLIKDEPYNGVKTEIPDTLRYRLQ